VDLLAEYRRATLLFEAGDPAEAARLLEPVVAADPGNVSARELLARAYFQSAQLGRAEEHLRELVARQPTDHYAHHVLGRTLERLNRPAEAVTHLRMAAAMRVDDDYTRALRRVEATLDRRRRTGPG
jgi:predicted Zn-dependent protease